MLSLIYIFGLMGYEFFALGSKLTPWKLPLITQIVKKYPVKYRWAFIGTIAAALADHFIFELLP